MAHLCTGVSRAAGSGAFYYDHNSLKEIKVPLGQCKGNHILKPEELRKYFDVEKGRMGTLPEYLIATHLDSTWNSGRSSSTGRSWWDITGEVVAYRPIEWVPIVNELRTIPFSHFKSETTTDVETSEIFHSAEPSVTLSAGGGWSGMKMEVSTTTKVAAKVKSENTVIKELVMGMCLRVERVYERSVKLFLNNEKKSDSLTWDGSESWDDLLVPKSLLVDVKNLQFHPIVMTGSGYSDSLWMQALPAFDATTKRLTDMHLLFSNDSWTDWYVYPGKGVPISGTEKTLPIRDGARAPAITFIPVGSE